MRDRETSPREEPTDDRAAWQVIGVHSRGFDLAASVAALAVAAAAGHALLRPDDGARMQSRPGQEVVATLERVESRVRVKGNAVTVWDEARGAETLHNADQVFTDESSSALLRFTDQGTVELGERTLIAVERQADAQRPVLNVLSGSLRAKAAPGEVTLVRIGRDVVIAAAAGTEFTVEATSPGPAAVRVTRGDVEVRSAAGATRIDATQAATIDTSGTVATMAVPAFLVTPVHGTELTSDATVELTWRPASGVETLLLEVARDAAFQSIVTQATVAGTSHRVADLADGSYYWRLAEDGDPSRKSDSWRFDVKSRRQLRTTWPPNGHVFSASADGTSVDLLLAWSPPSDDPNLKTIVTIERDGSAFWRREVIGTSTRLGLPIGMYDWSVERGSERVDGRFTVQSDTTIAPPPSALPLPPPVLEHRYEIEAPGGDDTGWLDAFVGVAYADDGDGAFIRWPPVAGAFGYRVHISTDDAGTDVIWRQDTPDTFAAPKLKPGRYFLRVATLDAAGAPGRFSPASELVVRPRASANVTAQARTAALRAPALVAPTVDQKLAATIDPLPISLNWQAVTGAAYYEVEILSDTAVVFTRRTRGQDATAPVTVGNYVWRVRALPRDGEPGPWSGSASFAVMPPALAEALTPPAATTPALEDAPAAAAGHNDTPIYLTWLYAPSSWRFTQTGTAGTKVRASLFNIQQLRFGLAVTQAWSLALRAERLATTIGRDKLVLTNGDLMMRYGVGAAWRFTSGFGFGWREQNVLAPVGLHDISLRRATLTGLTAGVELAWRTPHAVPFAIGATATKARKDKRNIIDQAMTWNASVKTAWPMTDWLWITAGVEHTATAIQLTEDDAAIDEALTSLMLGLTLTP